MNNNTSDKPLSIDLNPSLINNIEASLTQAKQEDDRAFIHALGRGMLLLSAFENKSELTHQQLCEQTQLPKATVSRLIHTLQTLGFISQRENETYCLGNNLLRLSASSWHRHDLASEALPLLKEFALANQVSVNIATEIEGEMRYLACYRSPARLAVNLAAGSSVPIDKTAIGRAYFAMLSPAMQQQVINSLPCLDRSYGSEGDKQKEKKRISDILKTQSKFFHEHGYCLSDGDYSSDILAVAVPLYDNAKQEYTHALNASVPKSKWNTEDYVNTIVPKLKQLASKIENG